MIPYRVTLAFSGTWSVSVEARDEEEALALANRIWEENDATDEVELRRFEPDDEVEETEG